MTSLPQGVCADHAVNHKSWLTTAITSAIVIIKIRLDLKSSESFLSLPSFTIYLPNVVLFNHILVHHWELIDS